MKIFTFLIILCLQGFDILAEEIATIKISYLIKNSTEYNTFINKLESEKILFNDTIKNEEQILKDRELEINESIFLLSEEEYNNQINIFNEKVKIYQEKIEKYNYFLDKNIDINQKTIIDEIFLIVKDISIKNNIKLVLNEDQYFISSEKNDISQLVLSQLNSKKLNLEIIYEK